MWLRKLVVVGIVATLLVGATGSVALAAESDLAGRGWLACWGRGRVELEMVGTLWLQINGNVTIRDLEGDARVWINDGEDDTIARGTEIRLDDFTGGVVVKGSHFVVVAVGKGRFLAHGHGFAHLDGRGGCWLRPDGPLFRWNTLVGF